MGIKALLKSLGLEDDKIEEAVKAIEEEKSNLNKALADERGKRKLSDEDAKELDRLKQIESDQKEKDLKAKGEQNKIIDDLKLQVKTLEEEKQVLTPYKTKYEEGLTSQRNSLLESIPEDKREFVNSVLEGKDHDKQVELLGKFAEEYKLSKVVSDPSAPAGGGDPTATTEYDKAKSTGDINAMLMNAPTL